MGEFRITHKSHIICFRSDYTSKEDEKISSKKPWDFRAFFYKLRPGEKIAYDPMISMIISRRLWPTSGR